MPQTVECLSSINPAEESSHVHVLLDASDPPYYCGVVMELVEVLCPYAQFRPVVKEEESVISGFMINSPLVEVIECKTFGRSIVVLHRLDRVVLFDRGYAAPNDAPIDDFVYRFKVAVVWVHCQGRLGYVDAGSFSWFFRSTIVASRRVVAGWSLQNSEPCVGL